MTWQMMITSKGRLASCECSRCGQTHYWHEWASDGQADDLKESRCKECHSPLDPETFWYSPKRNWYAGQYHMPGYLDQSDWLYGTNKRRLAKELRELYGN